MTSDSHQFSPASKNLPLANGDGMNEVELGKTAPNESLECENKSDP